MIRTQVYVPEDLHRDLMLMAKTSGVNYSTLIRRGVGKILAEKKTKVKRNEWGKGFVGAVKLGKRTNSTQVVHEYYESAG